MFIRHLALLNPIQFIANTTIKFLIKRFDVNTVAFTLINVLYQTAKSLISSVGIFPTLRILRDIRKFLSTYDGKIDQSYFELINFLNPPSAHTTPFTPSVPLAHPRVRGHQGGIGYQGWAATRSIGYSRVRREGYSWAPEGHSPYLVETVSLALNPLPHPSP